MLKAHTLTHTNYNWFSYDVIDLSYNSPHCLPICPKRVRAREAKAPQIGLLSVQVVNKPSAKWANAQKESPPKVFITTSTQAPQIGLLSVPNRSTFSAIPIESKCKVGKCSERISTWFVHNIPTSQHLPKLVLNQLWSTQLVLVQLVHSWYN